MAYSATIGLEIHAELHTRTKMFCDSANDPDETSPNTNVCPVCLAHPGTLPVINREAIRHILRIGTAVGGELADFSEFDRKSYFYPDIPKGYQISQYIHPLVTGGSLAGVAITRVHLEEDTARSTHTEGKSLVDFNRAGIPLMELVTEPVISDAETAMRFAQELQLLLRTLGAGEANLEKGEMRIEANVSVSNTGTASADYVEVKNINSFRSVGRAIAYEIRRQTDLLERGERVIKATRGWDDTKQETFHQRFKEGSADYRYFPEPDLPKLFLSEIAEFDAESILGSLPELPWKKRERYEALGIKAGDAADITRTISHAEYFDTVVAALNGDSEQIKIAANYLLNDIADAVPPRSSAFVELIQMISSNKLSSRGAKDTLQIILKEGSASAIEVAKREGLLQESNPEALEETVRKVISDNTKVVSEYRAGKVAALQYLVGLCMKATKGAGDPQLLRKMLTDSLG